MSASKFIVMYHFPGGDAGGEEDRYEIVNTANTYEDAKQAIYDLPSDEKHLTENTYIYMVNARGSIEVVNMID